jgi:dihydroorotate dehydrogenase
MNYEILRKQLFRMDPEDAHEFVKKTKNLWRFIPGTQYNTFRTSPHLYSRVYDSSPLTQTLWSDHTLHRCVFPNPIGISSGFDKSLTLYDQIHHLGFGFAEVGSVTAHPHKGNPRPRISRFESDESLINKMGLPGDGVDIIAARLKFGPYPQIPVALNIAKTNNPDLNGNNAIEDILYTYRKLYNCASFRPAYTVINVSCPNTKSGVETELDTIHRMLDRIYDWAPKEHPPVLLKLSPTSTDEFITGLSKISTWKLAGFVCGNTLPAAGGQGGISGKLIYPNALDLVKRVRARIREDQIVIGCGGISDGVDAYRMLAAGANLLQIYTALIYQGPTVVNKICTQLERQLETEGITLKQLIGSGRTIGEKLNG